MLYDDDIDDMLGMYNRVKSRYAKHGWYFGKFKEVIYDEIEALKVINERWNIPDRIYKEKYE